MNQCDCYGCWFSEKNGVCGSFACSECDEEGEVVLATEDVKDNGGAYRPCAKCKGAA